MSFIDDTSSGLGHLQLSYTVSIIHQKHRNAFGSEVNDTESPTTCGNMDIEYHHSMREKPAFLLCNLESLAEGLKTIGISISTNN